MKRVALFALIAVLLFAVAPSSYAVPYFGGDYNSIFFENAEVLNDNDQNGEVSVGDVFWGVFNAQNIKGPTDPSGQIGPNLWLSGGSMGGPAEITGYFANQVVDIKPGAGPGGTDIIILGAVATDPNGILGSGEVVKIFEDDVNNYDNSTQASGLASATDGTASWTLGMGPSTDGDSPGGYWYTYASVVPPGPNSPVGDSYAGLNFVSPSGDYFKAIDDPNELYANLPVEIWFNSEIFQVYNITDTVHFHFGSNDPAVFHPIPEPASLVLLGSGLLGLAGIGFRRKKRV